MEKPSHLPTKPGVYLFKGEQNEVLYVGKANNLKSRVGSYFAKNSDPSTSLDKARDRSLRASRPWIVVMMGLAKDVETIVVNNEMEALILEATLIQDFLPKFNLRLTDDKAYPYIKLTVKEPFPRLQVVRRRIKDGSKYFGPYLNAWSLNVMCEFLRRVYGVHVAVKPIKVQDPSTPFDKAQGKPLGVNRPCLNCQLEGNLCPHSGEISEETYANQVSKVIDFLQGKKTTLLQDLENRMHDASEKQLYELAGKLKTQLQGLKHTQFTQNVIGTTHEDFDVVAARSDSNQTAVSVVIVREGVMVAVKAYSFQTPLIQNETEIIREFIVNYYKNFSQIPPELIVESDIDDKAAIEKWLSNISNRKFVIQTTQKGEKSRFLELAVKNAQEKLESQILKDGNDISALIALKELLKLEKLPNRIEAVDISNLGSSEPVGATVCFINGQPDKNEYRKYKIRTVEGQNDFAMIQEVAKRRFSDTRRPLPDLFVVDGGPEQLKSAIKGIESTGLYRIYAISRVPEKEVEIPQVRVISLAKKPDRIFLPGKKMPVANTRNNKGLRLLSRARDEVHRFGIGFQRKRQSKKSLSVD